MDSNDQKKQSSGGFSHRSLLPSPILAPPPMGVPIVTDMLTHKRERISFARVLVEVDITKDLLTLVELELPGKNIRKQEIVYEFLPKYCINCESFGHYAQNCPLVDHNFNRKSDVSESTRAAPEPDKAKVSADDIVAPTEDFQSRNPRLDKGKAAATDKCKESVNDKGNQVAKDKGASAAITKGRTVDKSKSSKGNKRQSQQKDFDSHVSANLQEAGAGGTFSASDFPPLKGTNGGTMPKQIVRDPTDPPGPT